MAGLKSNLPALNLALAYRPGKGFCPGPATSRRTHPSAEMRNEVRRMGSAGMEVNPDEDRIGFDLDRLAVAAPAASCPCWSESWGKGGDSHLWCLFLVAPLLSLGLGPCAELAQDARAKAMLDLSAHSPRCLNR